ncbi:MFS transporter [Schaedlerella sp.]|jgi:DHA3 family macrolide efflux protein-like MFS transporter|uniref:MFS transporter n=1 Tax=Schaedlerella sp. TaxID=2676057 RepID=UPI00261ECAC2|nr:MFS transporter [uncultured Schaedlerella sp.]MCI8769284.1 MFS transporter [Ruminococcus sp.]
MKNLIHTIHEMKTFLLLWSTQSFSGLGSAMTSYALVIWSYSQRGSALMTALLMVSSYAPYVLLSIFAGALSDRWNKKRTMLVCDSMAALTTVVMLLLLRNDALQIWHLYVINGINGLMNTVQQPASEVATTRVLPEKYYQRVGGLKYFSSSLNSVMTPIIATAVMGMAGMGAVVAFDLFTFFTAFLVLAFGIRIPEHTKEAEAHEKLLVSTKKGLAYLKKEQGIFHLILFLASINLVASIYDAAFPAMMLSRNGGSEKVLGLVNTVIGITTFSGSLLAAFLKAPKSRVRVICGCLLFSMSTENFLLAFGRTPLVWCLGGFLGWIFIPLMSTNLDAILRLHVPLEMQGRVYSVRNSLQFFTIPIGYFLGGFLVDQVFEPVMAAQSRGSLLVKLFGCGKGSGAAFLFLILAFAGIGVCLYFQRDRQIWKLEE